MTAAFFILTCPLLLVLNNRQNDAVKSQVCEQDLKIHNDIMNCIIYNHILKAKNLATINYYV
jgi:hypothetical protein